MNIFSKHRKKLPDNYPRHVAIIMDGNGRWAQKKSLPRTSGHKKGAEALKRTVKAARDNDIKYLTLFGFSSENWKRPKDEVNELMHLMRLYLKSELAALNKEEAKLVVIGDRESLDSDIVDLIENAEEKTKNNKGITLCMAISYGGRHDIMKAAYKMAQHYIDNEGRLPHEKDFLENESNFSNFLMTQGIPDPDLLIRTSGEQRISNFLLWQCAYSEFIFTDTLWPDFSEKDLKAAISEYLGRDRRFGKVSSTEEQN